MLPLTSRIRVPPHVLACALGEERVLLDQQRGEYYGLDPVAAAMWDGLSAGLTLDETLRKLECDFAASPETLSRDLQAFVRDLARRRLVEFCGP